MKKLFALLALAPSLALAQGTLPGGGAVVSTPGLTWLTTNGLLQGTPSRLDRPWGAAAISNMFESITNGQTVAVLPGIYRIDGGTNYGNGGSCVRLQAKTNVTIQGNGWPVFGGTNNGDWLRIGDCERITLRGLVFRGLRWTNWSDVPSQVFGLVTVINVRDVLIEDCLFEHGSRFGVVDLSDVVASSNCVVRRSGFYNFGSWIAGGVNRYDGAGAAPGAWRFEDCRFVDCARGIEPYMNPAVESGTVEIERCEFFGWINFAIGNGGSKYWKGTRVRNCRFVIPPGWTRDGTNVFGYAIELEGIGNDQILNNTFELGCLNVTPNLAAAGINLAGGVARTNVLIKGNSFVGGIKHISSWDGQAQYGVNLIDNLFSFSAWRSVEPDDWNDSLIANNVWVNCSTNTAAACVNSLGNNRNLFVQGNSFLKGSGSAAGGVLTASGDVNVQVVNNTTNGMPQLHASSTLASLGPSIRLANGLEIWTTNGTPSMPAPNGSLCLNQANGALYLRTNSAWVIK